MTDPYLLKDLVAFELLSVRSKNVLKSEGIETIEDLYHYTNEQLIKIPNCGRKSLFEISELKKRINFFFDKKEPEVISNKKTSPEFFTLEETQGYFNLSRRSRNILKQNKINNTFDLSELSLKDILKFPNCGRKMALEILGYREKIGHKVPRSKQEIEFLDPILELDIFDEDLGLSDRASDALYEHGIKSFRDLIEMSLKDLEMVPGLGVKHRKEVILRVESKGIKFVSVEISFQSEKDKSENLFVNYFGLDTPLENTKLSPNVIKELKQFSLATIKDLIVEDAKNGLKHYYFREFLKPLVSEIHQLQGYVAPNFLDLFDYYLSTSVGKSKRKVLEDRIFGQLTLEQAGKLSGVTRERIRQIEAKAIKRILRMGMTERLNQEISKVYENTKDPIFLSTLELHNDFFKGISKKLRRDKAATSLNRFLFNDNNDSLFTTELVEGSLCIYLKDSLSYEETLKACLKDKELKSSTGKTKNYTTPNKKNVALMARSLGRPDLTNIIFDKLNEKPNSRRGKTIRGINNILEETKVLLSNSEIKKKLEDQYNVVAPDNVIGDAMDAIGNIYLFGKAKWGKEEKFRKLDKDGLRVLNKHLVPFIKKSGMKRWSTLSLLKKIQESDNSTLKNLLIGFDEFHLNWAMRKINEQNNEFQDMKRFRWSLKGEKLIQINALVIDFLKESGEPKNHASIEKYIEAERGTLSTFQIHITKNWPELIRLDTGLYGIRSRDLNLSEQDESLILKTILDALASEKIEKIAQ